MAHGENRTSRCARHWKLALRRSSPLSHVGIVAQAVTRTQIFTVASVPVTDNQLERVPRSGGETVPTNLGFRALEISINLSTADKEALGKMLALNIFTIDDAFVAGFNWISYGTQITVVDPDGTSHIDPDPTLGIPLANIAGKQIYLTYQAVGLATAGVTINGIN